MFPLELIRQAMLLASHEALSPLTILALLAVAVTTGDDRLMGQVQKKYPPMTPAQWQREEQKASNFTNIAVDSKASLLDRLPRRLPPEDLTVDDSAVKQMKKCPRDVRDAALAAMERIMRGESVPAKAYRVPGLPTIWYFALCRGYHLTYRFVGNTLHVLSVS